MLLSTRFKKKKNKWGETTFFFCKFVNAFTKYLYFNTIAILFCSGLRFCNKQLLALFNDSNLCAGVAVVKHMAPLNRCLQRWVSAEASEGFLFILIAVISSRSPFLFKIKIFEGKGFFFYSTFLKAESVVWWVSTVKNCADMSRHLSSFWCKSRACFEENFSECSCFLSDIMHVCSDFACVGPFSRALELIYEWKADSKVFNTMQEGAVLQCSFLVPLTLSRYFTIGYWKNFLSVIFYIKT